MQELLSGLKGFSFSFSAVIAIVFTAISVACLATRYYYKVLRDRKFRKRSHAIMTGLVNEQFAPLLAGFPGSGSEARFIGTPIDYIVFSGLAKGSVHEVLFVEVKTHSGVRLSSIERSVRDAIENGRVRWKRFDAQ